LAIRTMKIAAQHAEGERVAAGMHMEERLFLPRTTSHAVSVAKRHAQLAAFIEAYLANPAPTRRYQAPVTARHATNPAVLRFPKHAHAGVMVEQVGQRTALFRALDHGRQSLGRASCRE